MFSHRCHFIARARLIIVELEKRKHFPILSLALLVVSPSLIVRRTPARDINIIISIALHYYITSMNGINFNCSHDSLQYLYDMVWCGFCVCSPRPRLTDWLLSKRLLQCLIYKSSQRVINSFCLTHIK